MFKKTINYVVEGKWKNEELYLSYKNDFIKIGGGSLKKEYISSYTVLDENNINSSEYSFLKGALGVAIFGGAGAVAGIGGKKKTTKEYLISIEWKSGEKSLILIDDEYYKTFVKSMF
jgi:hypothetical protein